MNYTKTPITNDHAKIRAIGEDNNEQVRTLYKQEAKHRRTMRLIKGGIIGLLIFIILVVVGVWLL
ncbi:MAG: hypothetical protein KKF56_05720 [Nanoarchaeota archaeon]|nr:hypothetical protein [Nanoarchaeota archaeon]